MKKLYFLFLALHVVSLHAIKEPSKQTNHMYHLYDFMGFKPAESICPKPSVSLAQWDFNSVAAAQWVLMEKTSSLPKLWASLTPSKIPGCSGAGLLQVALKEAINLSGGR